MVTPPLDMYMALSDAELLAEIRELTLALTSGERSSSSWDVGSYSLNSPAEMRKTLASMQRSYARRTGQPLPPNGIRYHRLVVRKDYR